MATIQQLEERRAPATRRRGVDQLRPQPVVRLARLFGLDPHPKAADASAIQTALTRTWKKHHADLIPVVASAAGVAPHEVYVVEDEEIRRKKDGDTPVIDFPRVRTTDDAAIALDLRLCVAICLDTYSSKVWTRVAVPFDMQPRGGDTAELVSVFRAVAEAVTNWAYPYSEAACRLRLPESKLDRRDLLEVSIIGSTDPRIGSYLEAVASGELTIDDLTATPSKRRVLSKALEPLTLQNLDAVLEDEELLVFTSPASVVSDWPALDADPGEDSGLRRLITSDALYFMRERGGRTQALGIGFDDSPNPRYAQESALRVSQWIASGV